MSDQRIFPTLRYRDAHAAIDWLERAFGFERRAVHAGDGDTVAHAELALGGSIIMLGTAREGETSGYQAVAPAPGSGSHYVLVDDVDAHAAQAREAGAEILSGPAGTDYGSREYLARDPEGNVWSFGTYDPWAPAAG
jgi:uncharacterized glyoxalase superfamily protein PhnB